MECTQTIWLSDKEYLLQFNKKVTQLRVPLSGGIDLTQQCNLRCVHCYLGDQACIRVNFKKELSTAEWIALIDEVTEAGCLYLLLTGGEPLLRKDFSGIYRHAKTNGLLVTVFTNGTLITDRILELFDDLPPHAVEVSLYGATVDTYEKITGVKGSYERCLNGIRQLLDHKINLKLKTILMTYNCHELLDIEKMANEYGVKFRFDAAIFPCFNGDKAPLTLRVTPEEAIGKEFADDDRLRQWQDFYKKRKDLSESDTLYNCGAGLTNFHIDPYGNLQPCLMTNSYKYNLLSGSFLTGWRDVIPRIREKKAAAGYVCNRCEKRTLCGVCPAFFELENGSENVLSEYLCAMGQHRFQVIHTNNSKED